MSQNKNPDAVSDSRQFAGHVAPSEPLMTGGVSSCLPFQRAYWSVLINHIASLQCGDGSI